MLVWWALAFFTFVRPITRLKGECHKINPSIQKFVGCYKQVIATHKSGSSKSNIILDADNIYLQDKGYKFTFEDAWRLLKYEPKWRAGSLSASTKRTNNSTYGAYSSSSNPLKLTSSEYNPLPPTSLHNLIG